MPDGGKPGIKDLFHTIKKSPALMVTVIAGILIVGYILIKYGPSAKGGANTTTPDTQTALPTATSQGSYFPFQQNVIEPIVLQVTPGGGPTPAGGAVTSPPTGSASGGSPSPGTGITMPPPGGGGSTQGTSTIPSSDGHGGFFGLLGPNAKINTSNRTYTNAQGQQVPLPIPPNAKVVQGSQNRVWYTYNNQQYLLTSGNGPGSATPVQAPGSQFQSSSGGTVNQQNTQSTSNVTNTPSTVPAHA
jgi:hypothetical protein